MRQAMNTLKLLATFSSSRLSRNTKVVLPYRLFSTLHEKTVTVEQYHFDLLKKDSKVLSQQVQSLSSSINNLDNKFTTALQTQSNHLDNKLTNGFDSLRKEIKEESKALESKLESKIEHLESKLESKIEHLDNQLDSKIESLRKDIKSNNRQVIGVAIALASLFFSYDQYNKEQNKKELKASLVNEAPAKPAEKSAFKFPSIFSSSHSTAKDPNVLPRA